MWTKEEILVLLEKVMDPEIPVLSLLDLGVITDIEITPANQVVVSMAPTFSGCPAMEYMRRNVEATLTEAGVQHFEVRMNFDKPWNTNKITPAGRVALKNFGLAPPPVYQVVPDLNILEHTACPYCNSTDTSLRTPFGPTLCRAMHYCNNCRQMFEQFKPL
jgi:ring-1,2-phenylacetyl-CoA epoxidase subunit PaaD